MITTYHKKSAMFATQRIYAHTILFSKAYYWMLDVDGTTYLLPVGPDGEPVLV